MPPVANPSGFAEGASSAKPEGISHTLTVPSALAEASRLLRGLNATREKPDGCRRVSAWWLTTFPGLAIAASVLAINFFGDGLRDALDPRRLVFFFLASVMIVFSQLHDCVLRRSSSELVRAHGMDLCGSVIKSAHFRRGLGPKSEGVPDRQAASRSAGV